MRKLGRGLFILLALTLVLTLLSIACSESSTSETSESSTSETSESSTEEPGTIKIGAMIELTGSTGASTSLAAVGQGVAIGANWINDNGGLTINGKTYLIDLILEDAKQSPDASIAAANKLVYEDEVKFIVGPTITFLYQSVAEITEEAGVLRAMSKGGNVVPDTIGTELPYSFASSDNVNSVAVSFDYLMETWPEVETIAIIAPEEAGALYLQEAEIAQAESLGLEVVYTGNFPWGTTDFYSLWNQILAVEPQPDVLCYGSITCEYAGNLVKQGRELGFDGVIFNSCLQGNPDVFVSLAGEAATNCFSLDWDINSDSMTPLIKELKEMLLKDYGIKATSMDQISGMESLWFMTQAIEAAQSFDPAEVAVAWANMTSIESASGTGEMAGMEAWGVDHIVVTPIPILRYDNGTYEHVKWVMPPTD